MADIVINRKKKIVHILTKNLNRNYTLISDNIDMNGYASGKWYIINIETDGNKGKIIFPTEHTNVILIG